MLHTDDPIALIHFIHERKMKAGVAISPDTPSSGITDEVGELADMLLVMTVYPGTSSLSTQHPNETDRPLLLFSCVLPQ